MDAFSGIAEVNGTRLYVESAGDGPPVLFLHGLTLDTRMWDDQWEPFAASHRVVRCDFRGFGRSNDPVPGEPYTHSDDLNALLDWLGIDTITPIGLSMGGVFAVNFALAYPERIDKLVLVDSNLGGLDFGPDWSYRLGHFFELAKSDGLAEAKAYWLRDPLFQGSWPYPEVVARLTTMVEQYRGWRLLNDDPHRPMNPPAIARLGEIRAATLVIAGEHDIEDFHVVARALTTGIPSSRLAVLERAGHMANMDNSDEFNRLVLDFLAET